MGNEAWVQGWYIFKANSLIIKELREYLWNIFG